MKVAKLFEAFAPEAKSTILAPPGYISSGVPTTYAAQRSASIKDAYADASFVYEVVSDLIQKASTLPVKVYSHSEEGDGRDEQPNHPAYSLLRRPNSFNPRSDFLESVFANRLIWGEYAILKLRVSGKVKELWPLRSDRLKEVPDPDTGLLMGWILNPDSPARQALLPEDVIFSKRYNPDSDYRGLSPISALRYQIELGKDAEQAAIAFHNNNAMPRGVIKVSRRASAEALKTLAKEFRSLLTGTSNAYAIPVLEEDMDFKAIQLSPQDAEYLHTQTATRQQVANAFGYVLAEDYPNATPDELRRARYANGVQPLTVALEEAFEHSLMTEWGGDAFPEFGLSHILDADFPTLVGALKDAILSGAMSPNAAGAKLNQPPVAGGDERYIPLNLSPLSDINDPDTPPRPRDSADGMGGDEGRTGAHTGENAAPRVDTKALADNYGKLRERRLGNLSKALNNRIRGILKREQAELRSGKAVRTTLPSEAEIVEMVREHSEEMAGLLNQYLDQAHAAGVADVEAVTGAAGGSLDATYEARASAVAAQFADARQAKILELLGVAQTDGDVRGFMNAVADTYGSTFSTYGEQVARTEVAYAHEAAASQMWAETGATGIQWNFGGGPCTTGMCEELDGEVRPITEGFAEGPPAHGYCTCYTTGSWD